MFKDKEFYRTFFSLSIALILQNVITLSVNLLDNIMLGSYSETALSGAAAVNQVQFVFQQLMMGMGEAFIVVGSQYWGEGRKEPIKRLSSSIMRYSLFIALFLFGLTSLFPGAVLSAFTTDAGIAAEGLRYLSIIRFSYLFFAVTQSLLSILRVTEVVKISFYLSVITLFVNCGINYILIFGNFGAPELGIAGAATGTLCARVTELFILIVYIIKINNPLKLTLKDFTIIQKDLNSSFISIAIPVLVNRFLWGIITAMQTVILGHISSEAIAANSVASNLYMLVKSAAIGGASAASIIVGKAVGEGDMNNIKTLCVKLQKLFICMGLASGIFLFFIRIPILSLYDIKPATYSLANSFLILLSIICVTMNYQMPVSSGIIRGGGDADYVMKLDTVTIFVVVPLAAFAAFVVKANPVIVMICLNIDQIYKCIPNGIKVNSYTWVKKLTI